ncbi:serine/threonine protein kinase [Bdellovibrionota bacterium FG-2]
MKPSETAKGYFFELTPERVLDAVETSGLRCTGRCLALNSFENRVYDVELENQDDALDAGVPQNSVQNRRVIKFYRPARWSKEQILEEHQFLLDLAQEEIPVIAPLPFPDGSTLYETPGDGIYTVIFPKVGGRSPSELSVEQFRRIGRLLGRIHNVGAKRQAVHRLSLTSETYGMANLEFLLKGGWVALEFERRYKMVVGEICEVLTPQFKKFPEIRIHGDCHRGNLLWNEQGPFFLDFDDFVRGPAVQDFWLLLPGRVGEYPLEVEALVDGYREMREFDSRSLSLIEGLRALRYIHYTAWIARRWEDPAFPLAFPHFNTFRYWEEATSDLEEQLRRIRQIFGS